MGWKPQVIADASGKWAGNSLCFATKQEAEENVYALSMNWWSVRETRVIEVDEPATHTWIDGQLGYIKKEDAA